MIELPEALNFADQLNTTIPGKQVSAVAAAHTPHRLAWYYGDKEKYAELLTGKTVGRAQAFGGLVEIEVEKSRVLLGEGTNIRFHEKGEDRPAKHQLLIEFADGTALSAAVQMYGGMGAFLEGQLENPYYRVAREKPGALSSTFTWDYFASLAAPSETQKLSLKALLATEQRIPGLGNGVLQDILFNAKMHPKKKVSTLSADGLKRLFNSLKSTLGAMKEKGGRDTESDLFGQAGGYRTVLSRNTAGKPCPLCGTPIAKEAYMGGSIYYCARCQNL
jgi:formamidopyrimidine-DNA glycosylase